MYKTKVKYGSQCASLAHRERGPQALHGPGLLLLLALLGAALLLSGCTVQPVLAGERPAMPVPVNGQPVIAIAPSTAASGDTVAVAGAGWNANEVVYLNLVGRLNDTDLQSSLVTTSTDSAGTFTADFVVPIDLFWQGATDLRVVASSVDQARKAEASFAFAEATPTATAQATPTPTATSTPLPATVTAVPATRTPVPVPTVPTATGNVAAVTSANLNMRSGPGVGYAILRVLSRGNQLFVLGQDASTTWLYVQTMDGQIGWVSRAFTNFRGWAPIVTPSGTVTPTPTAFPTAAPPTGSWLGEYFANPSLAGAPTLVRQDAAINFNWGYG